MTQPHSSAQPPLVRCPLPASPAPGTLRQRLTDVLASPAWGLAAAPDVLDFCTWLAGLEPGRVAGLHQLSPGECSVLLERLDNCRVPGALLSQWRAARRATVPRSAEEEGAAWLGL